MADQPQRDGFAERIAESVERGRVDDGLVRSIGVGSSPVQQLRPVEGRAAALVEPDTDPDGVRAVGQHRLARAAAIEDSKRRPAICDGDLREPFDPGEVEGLSAVDPEPTPDEDVVEAEG